MAGFFVPNSPEWELANCLNWLFSETQTQIQTGELQNTNWRWNNAWI